MSARRKLALFDLDHTLLPIDSDFSWGVFTQAIGWADPVEFKRRNEEFFEQYKAGTLDVHAYVRFATDAIRRKGREASLAARERFMREVIAPVIRPRALQLVQSHRDAGEQVVIVTATNDFVTGPIAQAFGVDELIAVKLEVGADGWLTGEIDGVPSIREGKVTRVAQWLAGRGEDWDAVETTFYSDSLNDLALLERCDHPVATNPDAKLRGIAAARGWRILDLFEPHP
jgi:HAD superfamily hydrolase (TIGR01490 family)